MTHKCNSLKQGVGQAQLLASQVYENFVQEIRPGQTEREMSQIMREIALSVPEVDQALTDMIISGENSSEFHKFSSDRVVREGELVLLDFSLVVDGWYSDMTRIFSFGEPEAEAIRICHVLEKVKSHLEERVVLGKKCSELYLEAVELLEQEGYGKYFPHRLGHGIGEEMHTLPSLDRDSKAVLEESMVFSIEPGIYLPGRFGARLEDLYTVDASGCRRLGGDHATLRIL